MPALDEKRAGFIRYLAERRGQTKDRQIAPNAPLPRPNPTGCIRCMRRAGLPHAVWCPLAQRGRDQQDR